MVNKTTESEMAKVVVGTVQLACEDLESCIRAKIDNGDPRWPPLKPATLAYKKKIGKEKPLIVTGMMKNAVTNKILIEGGTVKGEVGIWDPVVLEYAPSHEFGTRDGSIPERSFIRSTYDEEIDRISADVHEILGDSIEAFWTDRPVKQNKMKTAK